MTYRGIPLVFQGRLRDPRLALDTPAWFAWLESATHFCYVSRHPIYAMIVRKEKRRHSFYWFAYVKKASKLHNAYLGKSETLTQQKLETVVVRLNRQAIQAAREMETAEP
jgi:LuxR family transcriptional regulator, maltose regulon positive regulatory protein